jgi:hypothetical protein
MNNPIRALARMVHEASEGKIVGLCGVAIGPDGTPQIFSSLDAGIAQHLARSCLMLLLSDIEKDIRAPDPEPPTPETPDGN